MKKQQVRRREAPSEEETARYDRITKLEAQILERVQKLKANTRSCVCQHFALTSPEAEPYDSNNNYYDMFWKRFLLNEIGKQNILQFRSELENFGKRLDKLQVSSFFIQEMFEEWGQETEPLAKVKRRSSRMEESRGEICPHCRRTYKDEETLLIHIKIKHSEAIESEQEIAQSIF